MKDSLYIVFSTMCNMKYILPVEHWDEFCGPYLFIVKSSSKPILILKWF